jgi:hypothetical protein
LTQCTGFIFISEQFNLTDSEKHMLVKLGSGEGPAHYCKLIARMDGDELDTMCHLLGRYGMFQPELLALLACACAGRKLGLTGKYRYFSSLPRWCQSRSKALY